MIGIVAGALLAVGLVGQSAAPQRSPAPTPDQPKFHRVEFFGNPKNVAWVWGTIGSNGVLSWEPSDQSFDPAPLSSCRPSQAREWVAVSINRHRVTVWGWKDSDGDVHWCLDDVRSVVADDEPTGARTGATTPAKVKPGVDVPAAGVVVNQLEPGKVTASSPALAAEARSIMEAGFEGPCKPDSPSPSRIPTPSIPSSGFDWTTVAKVAFLGFTVLVGLGCCGAAVAITAYRRANRP